MPSSEKILKASDLYHPVSSIDTVVFLVSLTSFMDYDAYKENKNHFLRSLQLFRAYCDDERFNESKLVLLFNKTDLFQNKVTAKNRMLSQMVADQVIDIQDYWDWLDLIQAMFRLQHSNRFVFSYNLCASDPTKVRSILKELEDIIVQKDVPTMSDMSSFKKNALKTVKWTAVFYRKMNQNNDLPQFELQVDTVSEQEVLAVDADANTNIDFNSMLYKSTATKERNTNYMITKSSADTEEGFGWAVWKKLENQMPTYLAAKGYWQITRDDDHQLDGITHEHLDAILAILHHKKLRTQFDGHVLHKNPLKIQLKEREKAYMVSWWNMARMSRCNAITVDGRHYLHIKDPLKDPNIAWYWYDNDAGETKTFDDSCIPQLEYSYQANLDINFPNKVISENLIRPQKWDASSEIIDEEQEHEDHREHEEHVPRSNEDRLFNHCVLKDLMTFMEERKNMKDPNYVLRFQFNPQNQICGMIQLRINNDSQFGRDVQRTYNGRNSAWPA